jgi:hypothetical protein
MPRRRGTTVGTFVIAAIVVAAMIYAAFGLDGWPAMQTPYVIGEVEPSLQ